MDNKEFDDIIKRKLESLRIDDMDCDWNDFDEYRHQSRKDNIEHNSFDKAFDHEIRNTFSNVRSKYNSDHWILLKKELEAQSRFRKNLYFAKAVELLVLGLFVVTILSLWPVQQKVYYIPNQEYVTDIDHPQSGEMVSLKASSKKISPFIAKHISSKSKILRLDHLIEDAVRKVKSTIWTGTSSGGQKEFSGTAALLDDIYSSKIAALDNFSHPKETLKPLDPVAVSLSRPQRNLFLQSPVVLSSTSPVKSKKSTSVEVLAGPKITMVNTPGDPIFGVGRYTNFNTNNNLMVNVEKKYNNWALVAGVGYSTTQYKPKQIVEVFDAGRGLLNQVDFSGIKYSSIKIPLHLRYDVIGTGKLELFASTGVTLNVILDAEYELVQKPFNRGTNAGSTVNFSSSGVPDLNPNSKFRQKSFNLGVLHDGKISNNYFVTGSLGIGLRYDAFKRFSFSLESAFHQALTKGIGPNKDHINELSLDFGVKYQL